MSQARNANEFNWCVAVDSGAVSLPKWAVESLAGLVLSPPHSATDSRVSANRSCLRSHRAAGVRPRNNGRPLSG